MHDPGKTTRTNSRTWTLAMSVGLAACSGTESRVVESSTTPSSPSAPAAPDAVSEAPEPLAAKRVLVTGFNDWKELGDPPDIWRCRDNPSCRLLLGAPRSGQPDPVEGGALLGRLRAIEADDAGRPIEWSFETLPVTWGVSEGLAIRDYDLVVHLGLGVYDRFDRILVEDGAYNRRAGADAAGEGRDEAIEAGAERRAAPPEVRARGAALEGAHFGDYEVQVAEARESNDYLCNETHYRALQELEAATAEGRALARVHFVHIPYARDEDYEALAEGVAGVVGALVR